VSEDRFPGKVLFRGKSAFGPQIIDLARRLRVAQGGDPDWERLTPGDWKVYARPPRLPTDRAGVAAGAPASSAAEVEAALVKLLGEEEKVFALAPHNHASPVTLYVAVKAKELSQRIAPEQAADLPFLAEALARPYEVWISYERERRSGDTVQRMRLFKGVAGADGERRLVAVEAERGEVTAFWAVPPSDYEMINGLRFGRLAWKR
jgi:hypothetical protein